MLFGQSMQGAKQQIAAQPLFIQFHIRAILIFFFLFKTTMKHELKLAKALHTERPKIVQGAEAERQSPSTGILQHEIFIGGVLQFHGAICFEFLFRSLTEAVPKSSR